MRFRILPILTLIAVSIVSCGENNDTPTVTASPTPSSSATLTGSPTATMPTTPLPTGTLNYRDPTYGYTFEYPATWYVYPDTLNPGSLILYSYDLASVAGDGRPVPKDKLKVFFWVAEGVDKPIPEWLEEGHNGPGQITPPSVVSQTPTTLGGKQGLNEVVEVEDEGIHTSYYIPIGDERVFVVNAYPGDSIVWPEFETVLASIRFAD